MKFVGTISTWRKDAQGGMKITFDIPEMEMKKVLEFLSRQEDMQIYSVTIKEEDV